MNGIFQDILHAKQIQRTQRQELHSEMLYIFHPSTVKGKDNIFNIYKYR